MFTDIAPENSISGGAASAEQRSACLAHLYRALRSFSLYPEGHPLRSDAVQRAYDGLLELLRSGELILSIARAGFVAADGGTEVAPSPMIQSLAIELFHRRIKRLVFLTDLTLFDLQKFLRILTIPPDKIEEEGGITELMAARFIKTVWTNEIDLSRIFEKKEVLSSRDEPAGQDVFTPEREDAFIPTEEEQRDASLEDILSRMAVETDDDRYVKLADMMLVQAQMLQEEHLIEPLLPALVFLNGDERNTEKSATRRRVSWETLDQLLFVEAVEFLLDRLGEPDGPESVAERGESIRTICVDHWTKVAPQAIQRYLNVEGAAARAPLTNIFIRVGKTTLPLLIPLLRDEQWQVPLVVLPLVGEIGGEECIQELTDAVFHANARVRREAIRTLARVGGAEAEGVLINLLNDRDTSLKLQAILSLGIMQSHQGVLHLVAILSRQDMFLETLQVKKEAAQALGRIGDRQATPHLIRALKRGHVFARRKGTELRMAVAGALGQLGDPAALEHLREMSRHKSVLGKACQEAADLLERRMRVTSV